MGWMDGQTDGRMDEWIAMDNWMDGWMHALFTFIVQMVVAR